MSRPKRNKEELADYIIAFIDKHFKKYLEPIPLGLISSRFAKAIQEFYQYPTEFVEWLVESDRLIMLTTLQHRSLIFPGWVKEYSTCDFTYRDETTGTEKTMYSSDVLYWMEQGYDYYKRSFNRRKKEMDPEKELTDYEFHLEGLKQAIRRNSPKLPQP